MAWYCLWVATIAVVYSFLNFFYFGDPFFGVSDLRVPAARRKMARVEESLPISVIGTGPDLNSATDNGLARAAALLDMTVPEVANRATVSGAIEIGRHPGIVRVTFRAPVDRLDACGLLGEPGLGAGVDVDADGNVLGPEFLSFEELADAVASVPTDPH